MGPGRGRGSPSRQPGGRPRRGTRQPKKGRQRGWLGPSRGPAVHSPALPGKNTPRLPSSRTRRQGGQGWDSPTRPASPQREGCGSSARRARHALSGGPRRASLRNRELRPAPPASQSQAAAPARAPCTAAAPETAPRRESAGGTWCRRRAPPCPARAVLEAPPAQSAALADSLRHNRAEAAAAAATAAGCGLRRAGGRVRPDLGGRGDAGRLFTGHSDIHQARRGGTRSSRRL